MASVTVTPDPCAQGSLYTVTASDLALGKVHSFYVQTTTGGQFSVGATPLPDGTLEWSAYAYGAGEARAEVRVKQGKGWKAAASTTFTVV